MCLLYLQTLSGGFLIGFNGLRKSILLAVFSMNKHFHLKLKICISLRVYRRYTFSLFAVLLMLLKPLAVSLLSIVAVITEYSVKVQSLPYFLMSDLMSWGGGVIRELGAPVYKLCMPVSVGDWDCLEAMKRGPRS